MDHKENQPLELEELDLALPDDLAGGTDFSSSGLDDLDLDLPELTVDDEPDGTPAVSPVDMDTTDMGSAGSEPLAAFDADDLELDLPESQAEPEVDAGSAVESADEEPIALSEEELERIMGSPDSQSLSNDFSETDMAEAPEPVADLSTDLDPEVGSDLTGSAFDDETLETEPADSAGMDFADMHTDLDDEEPVALSEEELGSIMGDVSEHLDAPETESLSFEEPADEAEYAAAAEDLDDENIALSDDELNSILLDASDLEISRPAEPSEAPRLAEMGLDEEDEPIALTAEELGNIISDVTEVSEGEESPEAQDLPAVGILDEEDEGPVALSDDELNSILEDVREEVPAESVEAAPSGRNLIVLDDYEDREKAEEEQRRDAAIERAAVSSGVEQAELKKMIGYLDQLFDKLPEETIREFSNSEYFDLYKRIMHDLGLS